MRVDADENVFSVFDIASYQGDVGFAVDRTFEGNHPKVAVPGRQNSLRNFSDKALSSQPVLNDVGNCDDQQTVSFGEFDEIGCSGHGAILPHDLADDGAGIEPRDSGKVDRGFGLAGADENTPVPGPQGEDMPWACQIAGFRRRVDSCQDCLRPVRRRDSRRDVTFGFDRNAERRPVGGVVGGIGNH